MSKQKISKNNSNIVINDTTLTIIRFSNFYTFNIFKKNYNEYLIVKSKNLYINNLINIFNKRF